ncbi:50S ribosomal protein L25 [Paenibacillus sp. HB172176]|uniref:50S ribosomal protein L25 n=1 Tax=Paenibacillus sp. HB172176 TaxID=2493690 RepID=UPI001438B870|nr:50S ribosomal protein L25 [Paenibacillus sp. HB172176]
MATAMKAEERVPKRKSDLRQLRQNGRIPGIVYGKNMGEASAVSVSEKDLSALLRSHPNAVLELDVANSGKQSVMVADVQRHSLNQQQLLHVDFHQVNMNEKVKAHIRIEAVGDSVGVREGGVLQIIMHDMEVQCLPGSIPDMVTVDISELAVGESLHVSDIDLPEGVEAKSEAQQVVVTVLAPQKEISEEEKEAQDVAAEEAESRSDEANHEEMSTSS